MMMARRFEAGFHLIERCRRELSPLAGDFPPDSPMHAALRDMAEAAARIDQLLRDASGLSLAVTQFASDRRPAP
jgi:hypothetical protein